MAASLVIFSLTNAWADRAISFDRDIRPILSENCYYCHGKDAHHRKAGLRLDLREEALKTLKSGVKALVPGKPDESNVVTRILSEDKDEQMPPADSHRALSERDKRTIRNWIAEGAVYESHWTFIAPKRPALPEVAHKDWPRNAIDRLVLARLEREGLEPSPEADRPTLIRRVTLDLTGLPPSPEEVDAFVADQAPDAYERVVDRLLASPHYGERMALPWLDAARYADSNGFQSDGDNSQWLWRDWVVRALNADVPFDRFSIEQLAGDLLPSPTRDQLIATAFNRNHPLYGEAGAILEEQRFAGLFDCVDTTATTWLGLTAACAQCHDHKYDPITQRDYYSLLHIFNQSSETGVVGTAKGRVRVAKPWLEVTALDHESKLAELRASFDRASRKDASGNVDLAASKEARDALKKYDSEIPRVMIMRDDNPRDTFVLDRGEYLRPKEKVSFATPAFLPPPRPAAPQNRLGFAQWLFQEENPLPARVQVNRMWQLFFGVGLVKTCEDLGLQGDEPTYPEAIDWLAVEFREGDWSAKHMHRLIVTSATYRQSSRISKEMLARDPENKMLARGARFRWPSFILRDLALAASGLLDGRLGGEPVYPYQPPGSWESLAYTRDRDFTYPQSHGADLYRRSLYTFWRRTITPANMFDSSKRQTCVVRRARTNTPLQALTMLNDTTWVEAARVLAARALENGGGLDAELTYAFRRVLSRKPMEWELVELRRSFEKQKSLYAEDAKAAEVSRVGEAPAAANLSVPDHAALTAVCLMFFNLDEALTHE